jgi:hypothetical protein
MDNQSIPCRGKLIEKITVKDDKLFIRFDDCTLVLMDDGQCCCETRYMTCDDDIHYWEGHAFMGYEIRDAPNIQDDSYGDHECQFLIVNTFVGDFTVANHNEHNGYYGGFCITHEVIPHVQPEEEEKDGWEQLKLYARYQRG